MKDVLVIGGGPAGAAAAIALARGGARVTLVERDATAREKVCGEFLGPDAEAVLERLGLSLPRLGAVSIGWARLASGRQEAGWALPFRAWSIPRAVLDEALIVAARKAGARIVRGQAVAMAAREGDRWSLRLSGGAVLQGSAIVLATGKHELRGHARMVAEGGAPRAAIGLKLPLRLTQPPGAAVLLMPCDGGYAGLQTRPGGGANLCAAFWEAGEEARDPAALLARVRKGSALAAAMLDGAEPLLLRPLAVAGVPYGFLHRDRGMADPALYRVGDQFAVIPSLAGDGMAMALAGGEAAAGAILAGQTAPSFHMAMGRAVSGPMRWAGMVARGLEAAPGAMAWAARAAPGLARLVATRTRLPGFTAA